MASAAMCRQRMHIISDRGEVFNISYYSLELFFRNLLAEFNRKIFETIFISFHSYQKTNSGQNFAKLSAAQYQIIQFQP